MQSEERQICPDCAESIPTGILACPLCSADLTSHLRPEEVEAGLQEVRATLDEYVQSDGYSQDVAVGSSVLTASTITLGVLTAFCLVGLVAAMTMADKTAAVGFIAMSLIPGLILGIYFVVNLARDAGSSGMAGIRDPDTFAKHFLVAALRGREGRAYAAVVPACRTPATVEDVDLGSVAQHREPPLMAGPNGFRKYWREYIARGPSLHSRSVSIGKVEAVRQVMPGVYAVDVRLKFASYPTLLLLGFFVISLLIAVVILIAQRRYRMTVTKVMIEHRGRLFMLEPELVGTWDRILGGA